MMNLKHDKYVRFTDWKSEQSSPDHQNSQENKRPSFSSLMSSIRRKLEKGTERISSLGKSFRVHPISDKSIKNQSVSSKEKILDPQGRFLQQWNKIFVLACVIAVSLDPLFFYIPVVDYENKCLDLDNKLKITSCVLRSITDLFYIFHIVLQFHTGFIAPCSRVLGRGELIKDSSAIAKRYLKSYFIVDILAVLPLPQMVILIITPNVDRPTSLVMKDMLKVVIFVQYVPRIFRIYPLYKEVTRTAGLFTETAWGGAAFNLFLFMLASNVVGAFWYLIAIERQDRCWRSRCSKIDSCYLDSLYCGGDSNRNALLLNTSCPYIQSDDIKDPINEFDFGIFLDALKFRVVEKRKFWTKLLYCFWWGLRSLSSLGQNLKTSTFVGEILFAIFISVIGLILFSLLIGNMQKYLQSIAVRVEEMRVRRRDAEQWMSHRMLPDNLRERIRRHEQYKWQETRGVEEDSLIHTLPRDLRRDLKRHLCWSLLKKVPMFEKMDEQLLDAMCDRLKPALYTEKSFIIREGDPVDDMLFLMRGTLLTITTNGGRTDFFNSVSLQAGDFCGEELFSWALDPHPSSSLPISTRTVQAETDIEAFSLTADDLKFVASQFRRLHSKQLQHTFRSNSEQWKTWGAGIIQRAWRRHCRNKLERSLREEEERLQAALAKESTNTPSLRATIYASRFAANALGALRRNHTTGAKLSPRLPLPLQKPAEPDFSDAHS